MRPVPSRRRVRSDRPSARPALKLDYLKVDSDLEFFAGVRFRPARLGHAHHQFAIGQFHVHAGRRVEQSFRERIEIIATTAAFEIDKRIATPVIGINIVDGQMRLAVFNVVRQLQVWSDVEHNFAQFRS
jgi:hypothetical protein